MRLLFINRPWISMLLEVVKLYSLLGDFPICRGIFYIRRGKLSKTILVREKGQKISVIFVGENEKT